MKRLQHLREQRGFSRRKLAEKADMHPSTYGQIESGRRIPYDRELQRISDALDFSQDKQKLMEEV